MHPTELTLNGLVDETLAAAEQADVERHLSSCERCRGLVAELREIRRAAGALPPIEPPATAWTRLEAAIGQESAARLKPSRDERRATPSPSARFAWLGIAAAVVLASYLGLRFGPLAPGGSTSSSDAASSAAAASSSDAGANTSAAESVESEMRQAEDHYDKAIKGLEQIAKEGEGELDPDTAATLQKNLAAVDQAIDESRAAVRSEPTSEPARDSLLDSFSTKIALLQDTVALINEMRKGNDAGAAQIVSGLK